MRLIEIDEEMFISLGSMGLKVLYDYEGDGYRFYSTPYAEWEQRELPTRLDYESYLSRKKLGVYKFKFFAFVEE